MSKSGWLLTKTEEPFHLDVGEGTDNGRAKAKGDGLKTDILGRVAGLDVHIALTSLAILHARSPKHRRDDDHDRSIGNPALVERCCGQTW